MKKVLLACAVTSMLALSASASASEFTLNPMLGASNNKAFGTNLALGLEAGYQNFIFGYTYTGDKNESNWSAASDDIHVIPFDINGVIQADAYTNESYKAHTLYVGYQFAVGAGHLAVKAGAEFSKYKMGAGADFTEMAPGGISHDTGLHLNASSSTVVSPMIGVGYYMDNGLNFNLHYTIQSGDRDMDYSARAYMDGKSTSGSLGRVKNEIDNKDFSTVMFTVGYRF
ncbi:outer membrane beta-barrel protein [Shewanella sp. YLB-07]|uniref:outer membrane beta-barrel protein n=1 Tax=Shewanella sp. YLB-07 TaxID=2601268 RepID=UPI00128C101C|nr:outer membrane beta-barrel protein [Shewanella sp. YLB-07]MPY25962.1 outer membrane beta-barrel protein [Shewanella sp. YLB-07]